MSKNVAMFVDVANLYYSARGQDVDVDYIALLKHATKGRDLIRAYAYSGLDPENENQRKFLDFLSKNGYRVVSKDIRKFGDGRVKANLDIELVVDLFRLAPRMDIAVIVSGDGDFASAIRALQDGGVWCEVISFRPNTSSDLIAVADEFTDIMKIASIGRKKGDRGLSMPEMPAKEVNPEFGFREASRGVAEAALAAIREGDKPAGRSRAGSTRTARAGGGRGRSTNGARAAAEVEEAQPPSPQEPNEPLSVAGAAPAAQDEANGEPRRRRRRRGGRGRGRRREGAAAEASEEAAAPADAAIGWEEYDDLSQLGELTDLGSPGEERAYTFEEADPATLAELGLPAERPDVQVDGAGTAETAGAGETAGAAEGAGAARTARGTRTARGRGKARNDATPAQAEPEPAGLDPATAGDDESKASGAPPARRRRSQPTAASARGRRAAAAQAAPAADVARSPDAAPPATTPRRRRATSATSTEAGAEPVASRGASGAARTPTPRSSTTRRGQRGGSSTAGGTSGEGNTGDGSAEPGATEAGETEGIWQRFRSGRTRRTGA